MKFRTQVAALQGLVSKLILAITAKPHLELSTIGILEHFLFTVSNGKLTAIGMDGELAIKSSIDIDVIEEGEILIPAKKMHDVVRVLNANDDAEFTLNDMDVTITSGQSKYLLRAMDTDMYNEVPDALNAEKPDIENLTEENTLIKKAKIQNLAEKTYFATANDKNEHRLNLNGVLLQFRGTYINAVATDSFRLVRQTEFADETEFFNDVNIVVPLRTIEILRKVDEDVILSIKQENDKQQYLRIDVGDTVILSLLIDFNFPNYESIIPVTSNIDVELDITDFLNALKKVAPFAFVSRQSKLEDRYCSLTMSPSTMVITTKNEELGESAESSLPIEFIDRTEDSAYSDGFTASFKIKYLEEFFQNITPNDTTDNIAKMHFTEPTKSVLIRPKSEQDVLTMIIMPVRV